MNQKPLPYPPKMRNGGLPPAHLPSPPHFGDAAEIVAYPKASMSDKIAALAMAIACPRNADARNKALADEANECRCHEAARALQETAAARASQDDSNNKYDDEDKYDDNDEYDDNGNDEYGDDNDKYDNNDEYDDDGNDEYGDDNDKYDDNNKYNDDEDEYEDVVGQFFACVDAVMAEIRAMDDGFENRAAAREKALADEANE
jgi:hypothetical protein